MRYTVTKQRVQVLGGIWWPMGQLCAQERDLSPYDLANIGDVRDRDAVASWIALNSGDFSSIVDFRADFHVGDEHIVHEWSRGDESECDWSDCMCPAED
jgi:hypothetical protein